MRKKFSFRKKIFGEKNKKVIFLLTGWGNKIFQHIFVIKVLTERGYRCIVYEYDKEILSSDIAKTVKNFFKVKKDILNSIKLLKNQGIKEFSVFGTSLGSVLTFLVANNSKEIKKLVVNLTGADLAEVVWSWDNVRGSNIKKELIARNIDLLKLKNSWKILSPINNIKNLKDKKILIYISKKDELIPYRQSLQLIDQLKYLDCQIKVVTNKHLNHILSGTKNLLKFNRYLTFLEG